MITRLQLDTANKASNKYPLAIAEKDYFLALAAKVISESPLGEKIVFKGGTAIHHCYLPQLRYSEDLDFSSLDKSITMDEVVETLTATGDFTVKKKYESAATIKIERLWYSGILALPGSIKVEIDRLQNVALPAVEKRYHNVYGVDAVIQTMDLAEVVSEKVRATATRVRYRDFFDLYVLQDHPDVELEKSIALIREKEVRVVVEPAAIVDHWQQALSESEKDKREIHIKTPVADSAIEAMVMGFDFEPIYPPQLE